jgi:hypothetical protein
MTGILCIISGGQTGADQGALAAAKHLGLQTGGFMPRGYATEAGPRPEFATLYGMREHAGSGGLPRTEANVCESDGTLIIGDAEKGGSRATKEFCRRHAKPCYVLAWHTGAPLPFYAVPEVRAWLTECSIYVLNLAGNRESEMPGIHDAVRAFLLMALAE